MTTLVKSLAGILCSYDSATLALLRGQFSLERRTQRDATELPAATSSRGELHEKSLLSLPTCVDLADGPVVPWADDGGPSESITPAQGRKVSFDLPSVTVHEIQPYAEVYNGVHPKDFHFGKGLPAPGSCFYDPCLLPHPIFTTDGLRKRINEDDESSDEEFDESSAIRKLRSTPLVVVFVFCCVSISLFGIEALTDIVVHDSYRKQLLF